MTIGVPDLNVMLLWRERAEKAEAERDALRAERDEWKRQVGLAWSAAAVPDVDGQSPALHEVVRDLTRERNEALALIATLGDALSSCGDAFKDIGDACNKARYAMAMTRQAARGPRAAALRDALSPCRDAFEAIADAGDEAADAIEMALAREVRDALTGASMISAERASQALKWSAEHDADHQRGQLAIAAAQLAADGTDAEVTDPHGTLAWGLVSKHRSDRLKQLMVAGALIAAEIDRMLREP